MERAQLFGHCFGFTGTLKNLLPKADGQLTFLSCNDAFLWVFSNTDVVTAHVVGHMAPVLIPRSEIDSQIKSNLYFSKMDVLPCLRHFCFSLYTVRLFGIAHAAETNQTLSQNVTHSRSRFPHGGRLANTEKTCYGLIARCRLQDSIQPGGLSFFDDVVPAVASLLWTVSLWGSQDMEPTVTSRLCQLTLPMYDQFQCLLVRHCLLQSSVVALVPVQDQKHS